LVKVVVDGGLREVAISHGHQLADVIYLASNLSFLVLVCGADRRPCETTCFAPANQLA
jgi:hypothetical protein